jgi:hypothetical protein
MAARGGRGQVLYFISADAPPPPHAARSASTTIKSNTLKVTGHYIEKEKDSRFTRVFAFRIVQPQCFVLPSLFSWPLLGRSPLHIPLSSTHHGEETTSTLMEPSPTQTQLSQMGRLESTTTMTPAHMGFRMACNGCTHVRCSTWSICAQDDS